MYSRVAPHGPVRPSCGAPVPGMRGRVALLAGLVLDLVYATGILASAARWRMYAPLKQMSWHHPLNKC